MVQYLSLKKMKKARVIDVVRDGNRVRESLNEVVFEEGDEISVVYSFAEGGLRSGTVRCTMMHGDLRQVHVLFSDGRIHTLSSDCVLATSGVVVHARRDGPGSGDGREREPRR